MSNDPATASSGKPELPEVPKDSLAKLTPPISRTTTAAITIGAISGLVISLVSSYFANVLLEFAFYFQFDIGPSFVSDKQFKGIVSMIILVTFIAWIGFIFYAIGFCTAALTRKIMFKCGHRGKAGITILLSIVTIIGMLIYFLAFYPIVMDLHLQINGYMASQITGNPAILYIMLAIGGIITIISVFAGAAHGEDRPYCNNCQNWFDKTKRATYGFEQATAIHAVIANKTIPENIHTLYTEALVTNPNISALRLQISKCKCDEDKANPFYVEAKYSWEKSITRKGVEETRRFERTWFKGLLEYDLGSVLYKEVP